MGLQFTCIHADGSVQMEKRTDVPGEGACTERCRQVLQQGLSLNPTDAKLLQVSLRPLIAAHQTASAHTHMLALCVHSPMHAPATSLHNAAATGQPSSCAAIQKVLAHKRLMRLIPARLNVIC